MKDEAGPRVVICIPTITAPFDACVRSLKGSEATLTAAGVQHQRVYEVGNPYVSAARATMLRKALDVGADTIVFIDHDLEWEPEELLKLIQTPGEVVAGLYRFKKAEEEYMGLLERDEEGRVVGRYAEGTDTLVLDAQWVPAGFLKVTRAAVARFMRVYPQLCYGDPIAPHVDLFNHGAHDGVWWGEDVAFSRNWKAAGGAISVIPDLSLTHHSPTEPYPGNLHEFLLRAPGGINDPCRREPEAQSAA